MGVSLTKDIYEDHFCLMDSPFSISPDSEFPYNNSRYRDAYAKLCHGVQTRKGFIVVTGEAGTGKTTLVKAFMQGVDSNVHTAFIFNPNLNLEQLLRAVLADLGIACSTQDRFALMDALKNYLMAQFQKDHIVVLLIDEAQDLSVDLLEELRLLSNLETDRSRLLQIVLIGQPELDRKLDRPELDQFKQRVALRCRLTPLAREEVASYIDFRLKTAGYRGRTLFEPKAVARISLTSQGIPRLINVICDNALLIAYAASKRQVSIEMVDEVARDLKLAESPDGSASSVMPRPTSEAGSEPRCAGTWFDDDTNTESGHQKSHQFMVQDRSQKRHAKRMARMGIGVATLLLLAATATVIYSREDGDLSSEIRATIQHASNYVSPRAAKVSLEAKDYLRDLTATINAYWPQGTRYLLKLGPTISDHSQSIRDSFTAAAVKIEDYFPRSWVAGLELATAKARALLATQWDNPKQNSLTSKASDDDTLNIDLAGSSMETNNRPMANGESARVAEPSLAGEPSKQAANESAVPDAKENSENDTRELPAGSTGQSARTNTAGEDTKPQAVIKPKAPPDSLADRGQISIRQRSIGVFEVVQDSFLRERPEANASITILPAGSRIRVESKNGDYFVVRSLEDPGLHGYVHREDAFFERVR